MLIRLLRTFLRSYKRDLAFVVVLQGLQTMATLYLPSLNADIIDKGVATGDTGYIWHTGGVMLAVTLVQVVCAHRRGLLRVARRPWASGATCAAACSTRCPASRPRRSATFGAPSLITRITNDVQQVQMLVLMTCTLLVAAPITCVGGIIMALREDVGLSWILTVSHPGAGHRRRPRGLAHGPAVPASCRSASTGSTRCCASRSPASGWCGPSCASRTRRQRFGGPTTTSPTPRSRAGRLLAFMFPIVMLVLNVLERRRAVVRRRPHRQRRDADRRADRVPQLPDPDPHVGDDGHVHRGARPRAAVCAERIIEVLDTAVVGRRRRPTPVTDIAARGRSSCATSGFHYPGAEAPVLTDISLRAAAGRDHRHHRQHRLGQDHAAQPDPPAVRRHRRLGAGRRRRRARPRPRDAVERIGLVPQKPYLFSGTVG